MFLILNKRTDIAFDKDVKASNNNHNIPNKAPVNHKISWGFDTICFVLAEKEGSMLFYKK
jgi:hypothetical protein